jgi:hypothetical protein
LVVSEMSWRGEVLVTVVVVVVEWEEEGGGTYYYGVFVEEYHDWRCVWCVYAISLRQLVF